MLEVDFHWLGWLIAANRVGSAEILLWERQKKSGLNVATLISTSNPVSQVLW